LRRGKKRKERKVSHQDLTSTGSKEEKKRKTEGRSPLHRVGVIELPVSSFCNFSRKEGKGEKTPWNNCSFPPHGGGRSKNSDRAGPAHF